MTEIKRRNFQILKDRAGGAKTSEVAEKYGLTKQSIYQITKVQLAKIADYDCEFARRLSCLKQALDESEANAKFLAAQFKVAEDEKKRFAQEYVRQERALARSNSEIQHLRKEVDTLKEQINRLLALRAEDRARLAQEQFEQVKKNITLFRK